MVRQNVREQLGSRPGTWIARTIEHSNTVPPGVPWKVNVADVLLDGFDGAESMTVCGGLGSAIRS